MQMRNLKAGLDYTLDLWYDIGTEDVSYTLCERRWLPMGQNGEVATDNLTERKYNTPYDDVFRTLLNDCKMLLLPVLNEIFGENYTGNERIVYSKNEHFMNRQDGEEEERITDASFTVIGEETKKYLFECQARLLRV
ncbi:MAG: hypothetical protein LUF29_08710 [Oscillospiraceae bacterium]|nr:hypothetical protein [Oscillospiraceae bacterium]